MKKKGKGYLEQNRWSIITLPYQATGKRENKRGGV